MDFRKSSYSSGGGGACVEVGTTWRKSSYSANGGSTCVEVATGNGVVVRDTTNRDGGTLSFSADAWAEFVGGLK
jgi:hypothetical protein